MSKGHKMTLQIIRTEHYSGEVSYTGTNSVAFHSPLQYYLQCPSDAFSSPGLWSNQDTLAQIQLRGINMIMHS